MKADAAKMRRVVIAIALVTIVLALLTTAWYTIDPQEAGVVQRFGRYTKTVESGLHFKLPFGIDRVQKVRVKQQMKAEFGFRSDGTRYSTKEFDDESIMLTGDLNVADVEWVTQYRVSDPKAYLFNVRHLDQTFRDMNEAVMREVIGDHTINETLTTGRTGIEIAVKAELQSRCVQYAMGVTVDQVILQDVNPPELVKPAFNEVNQAQQEKESLINRARQEYNKVIPKAKGEAQKMLEESEGYAVERTNRAKGEAQRFIALFEEYQKAPEVTRQRIYIETMEKVLGSVGRKIIIDEDTAGILPLLNLNQENLK